MDTLAAAAAEAATHRRRRVSLPCITAHVFSENATVDDDDIEDDNVEADCVTVREVLDVLLSRELQMGARGAVAARMAAARRAAARRRSKKRLIVRAVPSHAYDRVLARMPRQHTSVRQVRERAESRKAAQEALEVAHRADRATTRARSAFLHVHAARGKKLKVVPSNPLQ